MGVPSGEQPLVTIRGAAVQGLHGPLLESADADIRSGAVTLVETGPGAATSSLALALGGRLRLSEGEIRYAGDADSALRRRHVALVDVEGVSAPEPGVATSAVLAEELSYARRSSSRRDVAALLSDADMAHRGGERWEHIPLEVRLDWLCTIAASRQGVEVLVVGAPDRWGGDVQEWYPVVERQAEAGLTVIVLCSHSSVAALAATGLLPAADDAVGPESTRPLASGPSEPAGRVEAMTESAPAQAYEVTAPSAPSAPTVPSAATVAHEPVDVNESKEESL